MICVRIAWREHNIDTCISHTCEEHAWKTCTIQDCTNKTCITTANQEWHKLKLARDPMRDTDTKEQTADEHLS